jgi:hypothetical protein
LRDRVRWEFMSKVEGALIFWTWFSFFLYLVHYFKIFEIHLNFGSKLNYLWEDFNWCPPSVWMKASTLWNFNELKFWEHYVFSFMIKCRVWAMKGNTAIHQRLTRGLARFMHGGAVDGKFPST